MRKKAAIISVLLFLSILSVVIGVAYAWFSAIVENVSPNSVLVNAAKLGTVTYYTGNEINVTKIFPGWSDTKRVSIT